VKNITKGVDGSADWAAIQACLVDPAEQALWSQVDASAPGIRSAAAGGDYRKAFAGVAELKPAVAKFFDDVLVMTDDEPLRRARLALVATLRDLILGIADISEIATEG
jgi:glycyl-tRNA synthetase beta chain